MRTEPDLRWVALAVLVWEGVSVVGGGSYWLHYLICLIPGLVLAVSISTAHGWDAATSQNLGATRLISSPHQALAYCGVVAAVALAWTVAISSQEPTEDPTSAWLTAHARPSDTALVAFGRPNIVQEAGLDSPYPYLWSLIVRVKDPELSLLASILGSADRPDWLITESGGLRGWGIDPTAGDEQIAAHYRPVSSVDGLVIYLENSRDLP